MSEKRRDKKKRILRNGESQRKDGRYAYKYYDNAGNVQFVYSWKLEKGDRLPAGKRDDLALREKEREIKRRLEAELIPQGGEITVLELVQKYISLKTGVRQNTKTGYNFVLNILKKEEFGKSPINSVRLSDAKLWLIKLQRDGRGYSTIHTVRGVVRPAFQMAVDDDWLHKNPFEFQLATVVVNDSVTREAITRKQERAFLNYVRESGCYKKYYDAIYILFKTGLRISEFVGLTLADIDLGHRKINVDHQLQRTMDMRYVIEEPKTSCGKRVIPMTDDVYVCFRRIIENRPRPKNEPMVDGKCGFLFLDQNGNPTVAMHWEHYFNHICTSYNKLYREQLPNITPHVCRHTFCSNMAKSGMNPKTLQYLMGHSDIGVTLNTYTHVQYDDVETEMKRVVNAE